MDLKEEEYLRKAFRSIDDGYGNLSTSDVLMLLRALGRNPSEEDFRRVSIDLGIREYGSIQFDKFYQFLLRVDALCRDGIDRKESELMFAFKVYDVKNNGEINVNTMKRIMCNVGDVLTQDEGDHLLCEIDPIKKAKNPGGHADRDRLNTRGAKRRFTTSRLRSRREKEEDMTCNYDELITLASSGIF